MRSPGRFLLFVLLVIIGVKLSEQAYALVAFRDERAQARDLRERLGQTGVDLVFARTREDSLRTAIKAQDVDLERDLQIVRRFHREARQGMTPRRHAQYSAQLARYNAQVVARNEVLRRLESLHHRHQAAVSRYNLLADSLHTLAVKMGQPYYQVPTALEAAEEHRQREAAADGP
jgi:hypothetical protein